MNFILDKSGSMSSIQDSTISGFNEYLGTLKNDGNKYSFSLVLFDTNIIQKYTNTSIKDVQRLDKETYRPDGNTALYDAICSTIESVKNSIKENQKVLTIIMTDGEENSSKEYTQVQLKEKITTLEKTGKWTFVFLGANQDAFLAAQKFGVSQMNASNFSSTNAGMTRSMNVLASNTANFAMNVGSSTNTFFSKTDQQNLEKDDAISKHFSTLGQKSWDVRKKKLLDNS